jgi:broad specificity phosphatase PhoE
MNTPLFYVMRHGRTAGNEEDLYRGWSDESFAQLAPEGREDIREAAIYLKRAGLQFPIILADDLARSKESLQIAASILGIKETEIDKRLRPLNVGEFTGKSKTKHPLDEFLKNKSKQIPGGESMNQFNRRLALIFGDLSELVAKLKQPILVIGHGSTISFLHNLHSKTEVGYEGLVHPGGVLVFTTEGLFPLLKKKSAEGEEQPYADGTVISGFVTEEENRPPRECWNCRYVTKDLLGLYGCKHPLVQIDPQVQNRKQLDGTIAVSDRECCNNFRNKVST